jgi:hypothetical protein
MKREMEAAGMKTGKMKPVRVGAALWLAVGLGLPMMAGAQVVPAAASVEPDQPAD